LTVSNVRVSDTIQRRKPGEAASGAPAPRRKVTVGLTAVQAAQLRALWQEHAAALHAMLKGWCGDAQNASDMLQEVFRRLAEAPANMDKMKNARAFLAVSARRIAVDFARRSSARSAYQAAAGAEAPAAENPGPTDEGLRLAIRTALESLPAEQRLVFNHKILNGRTLEEIAQLDGISLNTAASRLRYALDKIRGQLRPYYDDLNRSQFKNMKHDLNQDLSENKRIITPLEPKRVPSVVPGLEGLAALSADSGVSDAPAPELAECYALPTVEAPAPEFVEPQIHIDPVFVPPPTGGIDPIPETCWEQTAPEIRSCGVGGNAWGQLFGSLEAVEFPGLEGENLPTDETAEPESGELPVMVTCEILPPDGQIPTEWLKPFELPEEFLVTIFEGEGEAGVVDGGQEVSIDSEGVPFDLESGFEICVLPVPEEFVAEVDAQEYLVRYEAFLADNPDWGALDPDMMEAQVITPSIYFSEFEFGTPSKAAAFDSWYQTHYLGDGSSDGDVQDGGADDGLFDGSAPFEPKELLPRYDAFLAENPTWVQDNQGGDIQLQVVTSSGYFFELEFGTPGEAAAFDLWYEVHYGSLLTDGDPGGVPTDVSVIDKPVYSEGDAVFRDGYWWVNGEIQPHWKSSGDQPEYANSLSGETPAPLPATPLDAANQSGGNGASSDSNALASADVNRTSGESSKDLPSINPVALAERVSVPEVTAAVVASGSPGAASFGLGADRMMIVEFSVLSPSEGPAAQPIPSATQDVGDLPASVVHGGDTPDLSRGGDAEAALSRGTDDASARGQAEQAGAVAAPTSQKQDPTTLAAGAVAVGSVAHGSGASAGAARRSLLKL
jgi:RNA polymerase sigma-70 factor (ECF subfamily)